MVKPLSDIDCWTLVRHYYETHGKRLPLSYLSMFANRSPEEINAIVQGKKHLFERLSGPEPFALVAFYSIPPYVSHIGVVNADGTKVIHATKKYGVVATPIHRLTAIEGFYKLKEDTADG